MEKSLDQAIQDTQQTLVKDVERSGLPIEILKLILQNLVMQLNAIQSQQSQGKEEENG